MALELVTICSNCSEQYSTKLLPSETIIPEVETYCPKCGFSNIDTLYEEDSN
jgi:DNA-directed RNA polymerase subunit RPC12/RpoP